MRVERDQEKGYRVVVDSSSIVRELREVTGVVLEGDDVIFSCAEGPSERVPLGAAGFRSLRRKMRTADFLKRWGSGKCFLAALVAFLVLYFSALLAVEVVASSMSSDTAYSDNEYTVEQPVEQGEAPASPSAEGWKP
jgi:hypothetical protein